MTPDAELAAARLKAQEARLRLVSSTHELQARIAPKRLANDAVETAKERGQAALDGAIEVARRRPAAVAAAAVGLLAFLARRRIVRLFRRKRDTITIPASRTHALPGPKGDRK